MRRYLLAVCGVLASVGLASAQGSWSPNRPLPLANPIAQVGCAGCGVGAAVAHSAPAATSGGCSTCGSGAAGAARPHLAGRLLNPLLIGQGCASPVGCASFASQRTFLFGGCNQFFNAGNKCGSGYPLGSGGLGNTDACVYGSYLNR